MFEALMWGLISASSLLFGAVIVSRFDLPDKWIGLAMGFGAGALISAVAYELVEDAHEAASAQVLTLGIALGALVFFLGDRYIERRGGGNRRQIGDADAGESDEQDESSGGIVLGAVLDGIPESLVIGGSLVTGGGVSAAMVAAAFISNLPESLGASSGLERTGVAPRRVMLLWVGIVLISGLSAMIGYILLDGAPPRLGAFLQSFAAGAILTMLADTMMPEAFKKGGLLVGLFTVFGFSLAFWLAMAE